MMKKSLFFVCYITLLYNSTFGQTTELVYSLGLASSSVQVKSIATDASDNIFICGNFTGTNVNFNPLVSGADSLRTSNGQDGFIAKYNSSGQLQKVIRFGNSSTDFATKVYVDSTNNVYLLAGIFGTVYMDNSTSFSVYLSGGSGAMALVKYNNNLVYQVGRSLKTSTGATGDILSDIKVSATNIYVTGQLANKTVNFNPGGTIDTLSSIGSTDIFVAKYNSTLICQWAYNFGGIYGDGGNGIDLDNSGNIYLTGFFRGQSIDMSPLDGNLGDNQISEAGGSNSGDVFVAKYSPGMAYQWAFNIGAGLFDQGNSLIVNKTTSDVYVAGSLQTDVLTVDFDPSSTTTNTFNGLGLNDMFIASYNTSGAFRWAKGIGGAQDDVASAITFDASNNVILTGYFQTSGVNFGNGISLTSLGGKDVCVAVFTPAGVTSSGFNVAGPGNEQGNAITYSAAGKVLVAGELYASGDYDPTAAVKTITFQGGAGYVDGFVARYLLCSPPAITTQPVNKTTCTGTSVTLSAVATGATSYQWKKGGVVVSGATSATYTISSPASTDAGTYTIDVINTCSTVTSSGAVLTVNTPVSITTAPVSVTVCSGSSAGLSVAASGIPSPTYQWNKRGVAISGQTTSTFSIASTVLTDSAMYSVTVTNSCNTITTTPVAIVVNAIPTITTQPSASSTLCSGQAFNASVTASSTIAITYQWKKAGTTIISGQTASSMSIASIATSDASTYTVDVTNSCGTVTSSGDILTVNSSPIITVQPISQSVCSGLSVGFSVSAIGTPAPVFQWNKNGVAITGQTSSSFSIGTASQSDAAAYTVSVSNSCKNVNSIPATLIVNTIPSITTDPASLTLCAGTAASFSVTASGASTYQWQKNGTDISVNGTGSTYTITSPVAADAGNYSVLISNSCGSSPSTSAVLTVNTPPQLGSVTGSQSVCVGISVSFTASGTTGVPAPTFNWTKNGTIIGGATSNVLTIASPQASDAGMYQITATNTCGMDTSTTAKLTVNQNTTIVTQPSNQSVCALGNTITFNVITAGTNLSYQWMQGSTSLTDNTVFAGSQTNTLTVSNVSAAQLGSYSVSVNGTCGTNPVNSSVATLSQTTTSIAITTQPSAQTLSTGAVITLSVAATGPTLSYQWYKNGTALVDDSRISGSVTSSLQITNAQTTDSDTYSCLITSPCATQVSSSSVSVTVSVPTSVQLAQAQGFNVAPNPSSGMFVLRNDCSPFQVEQIEIISMQGNSVFKKALSGSGLQVNEVLNAEISSGVYMLLVKGQGQMAIIKVVIDR